MQDVQVPVYRRRTTNFSDLVRNMKVGDYLLLTDNSRERHVRYNNAKRAIPGASFSIKPELNEAGKKEYRLYLMSLPKAEN